MFGRQEWPSAIHPGLHFVEYQQRSVATAQRLHRAEVLSMRQANARLRLYRLYDEGGKLLGAKFRLQSFDIVERNGFRFRQERPESFAPECIAHQRQRTASQTMECAFGIEKSGALGVRARKFDGGFDAFAAGTRKESLGQSPACAPAKLFTELPSPLRHVRLNHGRAGAFQLLAHGGNHRWMIVPHVVHTVAGEEIQNPSTVGGEEFTSQAALITNIHFEQVQKPDPLGIHMFGVKRAHCRINAAGNHSSFVSHEWCRRAFRQDIDCMRCGF